MRFSLVLLVVAGCYTGSAPSPVAPPETHRMPDRDRDGDGIARGDDCPAERETVNGYLDDDGCPDEMPPPLQPLVGVLTGIYFRVGSADLLPSSHVTLDAVVAALVAVPEVSVEIGAHIDDAPMHAVDAIALTQARAEAVKAYCVAAGIAASRIHAVGFGREHPVEDPAVLRGAGLAAARARNRRIELRLAH